jgi:hypothetical protein
MLSGLLRRTGLRWGFAPVWDFGLHYVGPGASFAPRPYVITFVSFDLVVAIYVVVCNVIRERRLVEIGIPCQPGDRKRRSVFD